MFLPDRKRHKELRRSRVVCSLLLGVGPSVVYLKFTASRTT